MPDQGHLATFTVAAITLAASAFDKGLQIQMEAKDDATYALWAGVGLETITLATVLLVAPGDAFRGGVVPTASQLRALDFRTKPFPDLAAAAGSHYPDQSFPPTGLLFMTDVRNKLLHTGGTARAGLVGPTTRMVRDVGRWLRAVALPTGPFPGKMELVALKRIEELPDALGVATRRIASDNADHLQRSLDQGMWDDTPELKKTALAELCECREMS
jgi:hypothetical protein